MNSEDCAKCCETAHPSQNSQPRHGLSRDQRYKLKYTDFCWVIFAGSDVCAHMCNYIASRTFIKVYQGHVCSKYQEILYKRYLHIYGVVFSRTWCQYHVLNSTCIVLLWIYYGFATLRDSISQWAFVQCIVFFFSSKWLYFSSHIIIIIHWFDIFCMIMVLTLRGTSAWPGFHLYISTSVYLHIIIWKCLHSIQYHTRSWIHFKEAQRKLSEI